MDNKLRGKRMELLSGMVVAASSCGRSGWAKIGATFYFSVNINIKDANKRWRLLFGVLWTLSSSAQRKSVQRLFYSQSLASLSDEGILPERRSVFCRQEEESSSKTETLPAAPSNCCCLGGQLHSVSAANHRRRREQESSVQKIHGLKEYLWLFFDHLWKTLKWIKLVHKFHKKHLLIYFSLFHPSGN